jgi:hypothetical protein
MQISITFRASAEESSAALSLAQAVAKMVGVTVTVATSAADPWETIGGRPAQAREAGGDVAETGPPEAMCATPEDCPMGPFPHPFIPPPEDMMAPCCCRQPWEGEPGPDRTVNLGKPE